MILALPPLLANACGFAGMACVIAAYAYITASRTPNPFIQHGVNLAGAALLAATQDAAIKAALAASTEAAAARGAFGIPTMWVDGAIYFGKERLPQIEAQLTA